MASEKLNPGFRFSQTNLDIFTQCRRRFFLRYKRRMAWPAAVTVANEHWEEALERGHFFHQLVEQSELGLEVDEVVQASGDELLLQWWRNFVERPPEGVPEGRILSEIPLAVPLGEYRLLAKFDRLVLVPDGRIFICDWKTGRKRPEPGQYARSWQTLVYRYVLAEGGGDLEGGRDVTPEQIELIYWHASYAAQSERISYSREEHLEAGERLEMLAAEIAALEREEQFSKTEEVERCQRCEFRSYCERGRQPIEEWDIDEEDLDWDAIPEAEF